MFGTWTPPQVNVVGTGVDDPTTRTTSFDGAPMPHAVLARTRT
jgi:hypothetical protein